MNYKKFNRKKGFTLIELMLIVAIISILSTMILVSINSARGKARDSRRMAELKAVEKVMEAYYLDKGTYPDCADGGTRCDVDNALYQNGSSIEYGYDFNILIPYLRSQKYIAYSDNNNNKAAANYSWWETIPKALAVVAPSYSLANSASPQDPLYPNRWYEYNLGAGGSSYRLRANFENNVPAQASLPGDFAASGDNKCGMAGYYCLGSSGNFTP